MAREGSRGRGKGRGRQIKAASHATQMIKNVNFNSISPERMRENERSKVVCCQPVAGLAEDSPSPYPSDANCSRLLLLQDAGMASSSPLPPSDATNFAARQRERNTVKEKVEEAKPKLIK